MERCCKLDARIVHKRCNGTEFAPGGLDRLVPRVFRGDVEVGEQCAISEFGSQLLALVVENIRDHNVGTVR